MVDITPKLCDKYPNQLNQLNLPLQNFTQRDAFWGEIVTLRSFHAKEQLDFILAQPGKGKVLVIDGHGATQQALIDYELANLAAQNGWEGLIIYGAVRDVGALSALDIGIQALCASPFQTSSRQEGTLNVTLEMKNQLVQPRDYIYADWNGIVISEQQLLI